MFTNMYRQIALIMVALVLLLLTAPGMAQDDDSVQVEDETALDLFDSDEERTADGWSRFYMAAGGTRLDADGRYSIKLPDGRSFNILNFDRAGLKETDSSYWLALNWRSANNRWGAWFSSWQYDVTGSRIWEDEIQIPKKRNHPSRR